MKKILVLGAALLFYAGLAFADLNMRLGYNFGGTLDVDQKVTGYPSQSGSVDMDGGVSISLEYLTPIYKFLKLGGGFEFSGNWINDGDSFGGVTYFPLYLTLQANPIKTAQGIFFKGNLGWNLGFSADVKDDESDSGAKGGIYFGLGTGYEFESGVILDIRYSYYKSSQDAKYRNMFGTITAEQDFTYTAFGASIGYKFGGRRDYYYEYGYSEPKERYEKAEKENYKSSYNTPVPKEKKQKSDKKEADFFKFVN